MDIQKLYRDYNIPFATEGHKHCRPGWVNTECPFCTGNKGLHLGYDEDLNRFVCWRCGGHHPINAISALLNIGKKQANEIIQQYDVLTRQVKKHTKKQHVVHFTPPTNLQSLQKQHKEYLEKRNFDADYIEKLWGLKSIGTYSQIGDIIYKHRIYVPFMWNNEIVTFDTRDITGKQRNKYQACPSAYEAIPHKEILYGLQHKWRGTGICVEGPTDVWRMGVYSFATSGIKFTMKQVRIIAKNFKRVPVLFDDDPQAIKQAQKLINELKFRNVDAFFVKITGDPGSLPQEEANYLVKQLI
jgi:DNA primase